MTQTEQTNPPRNRQRLGVDWLLVAAGVLTLTVSVMSFLDSDAPVLAQTPAEDAQSS